MFLKTAYIAAFAATIFGCSESLTERGSSEDTVSPPVQVSGSYLADYNNARIRCQYTNPTKIVRYEVACNIAIQVDGREILANQLAENTLIDWQTPVIKQGQSSPIKCDVNSTKLSQTCTLETRTSSVKLEFSFKVTTGKQTRQENAEVLLPYSVEVAAGYVPNLGFYKNEGKSGFRIEGDTADLFGFQTNEIHQRKLKLNIMKGSSCASSHGFYFSDSTTSIFRFKNGIVRHFAGSAYKLDISLPAHALRVKLKQANARIACSDAGIYVLDTDKIYFIDKSGTAEIVISNLIFNGNELAWNNFFALPNGELFFLLKYDLLKFDPITKKTEVVIKDYNVTNMPGAFNKPYDFPNRGVDFFASINGEYFYRTHVRIRNSTTSEYVLIRHRGEIKTVVSSMRPNQDPNFYEYPTETFGANVNSGNNSFSISQKGEIFFLETGMSSTVLKKIGLDSKIQHISNIPLGYSRSPDRALTLRPLYFDENDNFYTFDALKSQIVLLDKNGVISPFDVIDSSDDSLAIETAISPADVSFWGKNSFAFFDDKERKLLRFENGNLKTSPIVQDCMVISSTTVSKQGDLYFSCYGKIYLQTATGSIHFAGKTSSYSENWDDLEGTKKNVLIYKPTAMSFDKHGALFIADMQRIRRIVGDDVKTVAGDPEFDELHGWYGDFLDYLDPTRIRMNTPYGLTIGDDQSIYVADTGNNVIRKISGLTDGRYTRAEIIAGYDPAYKSIPVGQSVPAMAFRLICPTDISMTGDGVLYLIDNEPGCGQNTSQTGYGGPFSAVKGTHIRKIEWMDIDGVSTPMISDFFGGAQTVECGSGKANGNVTANSLESALNTSLSVICQGGITSLKTRDNCHEENGSVEILIGQNFSGNYGNVVHIRRPCKK